jgi:hypothetical protein
MGERERALVSSIVVVSSLLAIPQLSRGSRFSVVDLGVGRW